MTQRAAFNFKDWIQRHQHLLKPPVANRHLFDEHSDMVVMVVGGPNQRVDFHDDPAEEFFYQFAGDMLLKVSENGQIYDIPIREGEVFFLPAHVRHSPQRPVVDSIGLVVEGFDCGQLVHRGEIELKDIVEDLPPLFDAFYEDETHKRCPYCGTIHPGKEPPAGWAVV